MWRAERCFRILNHNKQTIVREAYEETGVTVKNIRFYKSQPWAFSQSLLMGFFCEADDDSIHMNTDGKDELEEAI